MASANVDLVRSIFAAYERGDYHSNEWADPAIEYVITDGPSPGRWLGLAGMSEAWSLWLNAWEGLRSDVEEIRELDAEQVLVLMRLSGRGKTSGVELGQVNAGIAAVYEIRDGKVAKIVVYWDRDRAFADLGLAPETDS
jgi:ketosteroid isomerase-like protein